MIVGFAATTLLGWLSHTDPELDARVLDFFRDLPNWLTALGRIGYSIAGIYALGLTVLIIVRGGKRAITRDIVVGLAIFVVSVVAASRLATDQWPDVMPEFVNPERLSFPAARLTLVAVVLGVLAPHLTQPLRVTGRRILWLTVLSGLLVGAATLTGLLGGLTLGYGIAGLVHVLFGSPEGLPPPDRLRRGLAQLGITEAEIEWLPEQPVGVALARATAGDDEYLVRIHGRDAADAEFVEKIWRSLWYKDAGPPLSLSGIQQVEHEVVASLLSAREGAAVQHVVTAGQVHDDALLVLDWPDGRILAQTEPDTIGDDDLDAMWQALADLHQAGIAHGAIHPSVIVIDRDRSIRLLDLSRASLSPDASRLQGDVVSMLATHVSLVGTDRAVDSMLRSLPREAIEATLPYLQEGMVAPDLRRRAKAEGKISDARDRLLGELDIDEPALADVRRLSWSDVIIVVFSVIAANALISQIAEIGFDVLWEELQAAAIGWLVVAFILTNVSYYGDVVSLQGVMTRPVPFFPTYLLQSAKRFIGMAVPATAGRVALDVRYLQKQGVSSARALAQGPLIGVCGFVVEITLLLLCAWRVGQDVETDELSSVNVSGLLAIVGVIIVVGIVVLMLRPKWRTTILSSLREALGSVTEVIKTPSRMLRVFGGQLFDRTLAALSLAATMAAFGQHEPFAAVVFVSVGTGLLAGLAPVPGGIGVAEATMTALLTAVGVPAESAFSIAIVHRLVTSYLPPVMGWFSYNWLTREGYL